MIDNVKRQSVKKTAYNKIMCSYKLAPLPPKARKHPQRRVLSCFSGRIQKGFERSEQNNTVCCFGAVTEDLCETIPKIRSKMLSKDQEQIRLCQTDPAKRICRIFCAVAHGLSFLYKNMLFYEKSVMRCLTFLLANAIMGALGGGMSAGTTFI